MERIQNLIGHFHDTNQDEDQTLLNPKECIGEMENRELDEHPPQTSQSSSSKSSYERIPIKVAFDDKSAADERYGGTGDMAILEGDILIPKTKSKTVFVFMHPSGIQNLLPMPMAMAREGLHVVTCCSRYPNNDSCLIMEKVVVDLGECIKHVKQRFGYEKVVLCGWSGGGSLSSFYQAQAESKNRIARTPAGDRVDLSGIVPADGLLILAAHASRAKIFTEWLDPSVLDEANPAVRDVELDLWDPRNPNKPPYSPEYITRFRQAQIDRNRRITKWAIAKLEEVNNEPNQFGWQQKRRDYPFVVYCTQADPRRLDHTLEPNGRKPTPLAELAAENHSPVGLARFTTCRSWLSQWSCDQSNADGVRSIANVSVPVLVLENEADHLVPNVHPQAMFKAVSHSKKKFLQAKGATHYYYKQKPLMKSVINEIKVFLKQHNLVEEHI